MNAARFNNALRIMRNIGGYELRQAGVVDANWGTPEASGRDQISAFVDDPFKEVLRMPDANFERLFALIESRQLDQLAAPTTDLRATGNGGVMPR